MEISQENKRIIKNIFYLGLLQGVNYILPLITIPYLVRVLGPDYFGLLAFAAATIMYVALITDYGFNLSATQQISIQRNSNKRVSEIFSAVMIIKFIFMFAGLVVTVLLVIFTEKFNKNWEVFIVTFGIVIGQVLFPVWLFQGIEAMKNITYINITTKILFTLSIFIFVNNKSDYLLVPGLTALGSIMGGFWSLYIIIYKMGYKFSLQSYEKIKFQLKEGWHVFISSISISLYTVSTTFILGLMTNNYAVGQFVAAEKIVNAAKGIYQTIAYAIYPMVAKKFSENQKTTIKFMRSFTKIVISFTCLLSFMIYIFSDTIINLLMGNQFNDAITILKIMSPLPLIIALSNIFGIQIMLNLGLKENFSRILFLAAIIGIFCSVTLIKIYQEKGAAYAVLITEVFVTVAMFICVSRHLKSMFENR